MRMRSRRRGHGRGARVHVSISIPIILDDACACAINIAKLKLSLDPEVSLARGVKPLGGMPPAAGRAGPLVAIDSPERAFSNAIRATVRPGPPGVRVGSHGSHGERRKAAPAKVRIIRKLIRRGPSVTSVSASRGISNSRFSTLAWRHGASGAASVG